MKKIILAVSVLMTTATIAAASCPPSEPYNCVQGFNGKVICGCGK